MRRSASQESAGSVLLDLAAASRELAPAATESSAASASAWSLQGRGGGAAAAAAAAGGSRGDRRCSKGPSSDPTPLGVPHGSPHGRRERVPGPGPELLQEGRTEPAWRLLLGLQRTAQSLLGLRSCATLALCIYDPVLLVTVPHREAAWDHLGTDSDAELMGESSGHVAACCAPTHRAP